MNEAPGVALWVSPSRPTSSVARWLDADDSIAVARLREPADADRTATGRAVLRIVVAQAAGVPPDQIRFERRCVTCGDKHGKPSPVGLDLHVSLSHAGDTVVAVAAEVPVGVDVERVDAARFAGFASVALSPSEQSLLRSLPRRSAPDPTTLWVRKEAWLKMRGTGLARNPASLELGPVLGRNTVLRDADGPVGIADVDLGPPHPRYRCAVAVGAAAVPDVTLADAASLWAWAEDHGRTPTT